MKADVRHIWYGASGILRLIDKRCSHHEDSQGKHGNRMRTSTNMFDYGLGAMMRYLKFRIRNFKGIKDTEIDLRSLTGANVFALVGLNESGKTTILEAIHSFSPDYRTRSLRGTQQKNEAEAAKERLPRHLLARFTGAIVVEATLSASESDKRVIANFLKSEYATTIDWNHVPDIFTLCRSDVFERGDYVKTEETFDFDIYGKKERGKLKKIEDADLENVYHALWASTPDIAYHDSFIFDFPKRIFLTSRPGTDDWVYRTMFEDVLAAGRIAYTLDDITRRIRNEKYKKDWLSFLTDWSRQDDKATVQQIIDQTSQTITTAVLGKWDKIFPFIPLTPV